MFYECGVFHCVCTYTSEIRSLSPCGRVCVWVSWKAGVNTARLPGARYYSRRRHNRSMLLTHKHNYATCIPHVPHQTLPEAAFGLG